MLKQFKKILFGLYSLRNRFLKPKEFDGVKILLYHDIEHELFKGHVEYLNSNYQIITLDEMLRNFSAGIKLKNTFVITFDDGIKENFQLLKTIIRHQIKPTIFITTGLINTNKRFWFNGLCQKSLIDLLSCSNSNRLKIINNESEYVGERDALNQFEVDQMKKFVDFQPHTISHPSLVQCSDDELENEIVSSCEAVECITGEAPHSFAPPFGIYDDRVISILRKQNIKCSLSLNPGVNFSNDNLFDLKRIGVPKSCDINEFIVRIDGVWDKIRTLPFLKNFSSFYKQYYE